MYTLKVTTARGQIIQHTDHDPDYLKRLAGDYSDCRAWALMRGASLVKQYPQNAKATGDQDNE